MFINKFSGGDESIISVLELISLKTSFDFLNNAVGINSASKVYFGKSTTDLDMHESAMLVGMAKNPSIFNPLRRPDTVLKRRSVVLYQMLKNEFISKEDFDSIKQLPLGIQYNKVDHQTGLAPYFRETLRGEKQFEEADKIRDQIAGLGISLIDHKNKTLWMKKEAIKSEKQ